MNCGRVSNQLSAYLDRELTGIEMLHLRAHLDDCDRCRAEHEALSRMKAMLGQLRTAEPPADFIQRRRQRFEASGAWGGARSVGSADRISERRIGRYCSGERVPGLPVHPCLHGVWRGIGHRLALIPWQPISLGLITAALAVGLIFTSTVRHRHADALVASLARIHQDPGQDPMGADWTPVVLPPQFAPPDPLFGRETGLHWVNVSLEGESSWPSR